MTNSIDSLTIKQGRLIETIHETANWGAKGVWGLESTQTGVCRLALSDLDKKLEIGLFKKLKNWDVK